jgi:hypothetical protein
MGTLNYNSGTHGLSEGAASVINSTPMPSQPQPAMSKIEKQQFRRICGKFASGITVATVCDVSGAPHGMTANSFTSVSITPPLVLICVDHRARILEHFRIGEHFGINILSASQRALSDKFAGSGYDRFEGITWRSGETGVPLFSDGRGSRYRDWRSLTCGLSGWRAPGVLQQPVSIFGVGQRRDRHITDHALWFPNSFRRIALHAFRAVQLHHFVVQAEY